MKLASLKCGGRDGALIVVDRGLSSAVAVPEIAATLQAALDEWERARPALEAVSDRLNAGSVAPAFPFDPGALAAPLPRAFHWVDGSAYLDHMRHLRQARGAPMPPDSDRVPLLYQGGSDGLLGACDPIPLVDPSWGLDVEAEVAVITGDVALGSPAERIAESILLVMLVNDISLRNLIPAELAKGFGFYQSKPASAFSPVAATLDEFGDAWHGGRLHLGLEVRVNDTLLGRLEAGEDMAFGFPDLIAHAARTRALGSGTIVGSGTVANHDPARGVSCIAEIRALETLAGGRPLTPYLCIGDRVRIEMLDRDGRTVFGAIDQEVIGAPTGANDHDDGIRPR